MRILQRAGLSDGAVQESEDFVRDPQHRERHFLLEMDHPDLGVAEYAAPPHRLAKTPPEVRRPTPRLGAHTIEVLGGWLDMAPHEAARYAWASGPWAFARRERNRAGRPRHDRKSEL